MIKEKFIQFLLSHQALQFGEFTLKSGRKSPYFFNLGVFNTGEALQSLGEFYAETLVNSALPCDVLFGPAYKGIPLAVATSMMLAARYQKNIPFCFNRKEKKSHGDQGEFVGAKPFGNMVMLDDVITAGTTVRESIALFENTKAKLTGIVIAFDREERGDGKLSAVQAVREKNIVVESIVKLTDVKAYIEKDTALKRYLPEIEAYQEKYGVAG